MTKNTKLHEILAVEQGLATTGNTVLKETNKTLKDKHDLFKGMIKEHQIFGDDQQHLKQATEIKEVQSTVDEQLEFLAVELSNYWDVGLQKEEANQRAGADIIIDDEVLASNIPAIVLLGMEKKLGLLVPIYANIPTLDAARAWVPAEGYAKKNVFMTKNHRENQQTITSKEYVEASPATKEFKAQIVQQEKIDVVGKFIIDEYSGAISSYDKAERIQRLTKLIRAVKTARQRANSITANTNLKFAAGLLRYVNG